MQKIVLALSVVLVTACGGGSSNTSSSSVSVSGVAMDGYLHRADVFLDLNGDGLFTTGEPKTTTNESGSFTLSATQEQLNNFKVVVMAVAGTTIDQDNPNTPITSGFSLVAPAGSPEVVSPLTTHVVAKMDAGASLASAKSAVQTELGLSGLDIMKNYVALKATDANYAKAHNVAVAITEVLKTIESDSSSGTKFSDKLAALGTKVTAQVAPNVEVIKAATSVANASQLIQVPTTTMPKNFNIALMINSDSGPLNGYPFFMGVDHKNSKFNLLDKDFGFSEGSFTQSTKLKFDVTWETYENSATQSPSVVVSNGCRSTFTFDGMLADNAGYSGFKTILKDSAECFGSEMTTNWQSIPIDETFNLNNLSGKKLILTGIKDGKGSTCAKPIEIEFSAKNNNELTIEKVAPVNPTEFASSCGNLEEFGWGDSYFQSNDKKLASSPKSDAVMIIDLGANSLYAPDPSSYEQIWLVKTKGVNPKIMVVWAGNVDWTKSPPELRPFSFEKAVALDYVIQSK
jgi:hypothetical protein